MAGHVNLKNISMATLGSLMTLLDTVHWNPGIVYSNTLPDLESLRTRLGELELAARKSTCPGVEMDLDTGAVAGIEETTEEG